MDFIANYESGSESENEEVKPPQKLKSYSTEFKLNVVKYAKDISKNSASFKFGISRSCVQDWVKQESKLHQIKNSSPAGKQKKRLQGGGRPLTFKGLDEQLAIWVRKQRAERKCISHTILQQQAVKMFNAEEDETGFKGSRGWLIKFLARHNFRLRAPTTVCQKPPSDYVEKIVNFLLYVSEMRQKNNYRGIYADDETAVYLDPSEGKCIDEKGAKRSPF